MSCLGEGRLGITDDSLLALVGVFNSLVADAAADEHGLKRFSDGDGETLCSNESCPFLHMGEPRRDGPDLGLSSFESVSSIDGDQLLSSFSSAL